MSLQTFGEYLKQLRLAKGVTLRAFCQEHDFDHGNYSRMERGVQPAPHGEEKIAEYAKALGVERGSDQWYELFDRAAAERGRIPHDLMKDEEVLGKLPVLFRTLRDSAAEPKKLDDLIDRIRRS